MAGREPETMSASKSPIVIDGSTLDELYARFDLRQHSYGRAELAAILGTSLSGVDRLLRDGALPSLKVTERNRTVTRPALALFMWARDQHKPADQLSASEPATPRRGRRRKEEKIRRVSQRKTGGARS
jgi:hypothetical protein